MVQTCVHGAKCRALYLGKCFLPHDGLELLGDSLLVDDLLTDPVAQTSLICAAT